MQLIGRIFKSRTIKSVSTSSYQICSVEYKFARPYYKHSDRDGYIFDLETAEDKVKRLNQQATHGIVFAWIQAGIKHYKYTNLRTDWVYGIIQFHVKPECKNILNVDDQSNLSSDEKANNFVANLNRRDPRMFYWLEVVGD